MTDSLCIFSHFTVKKFIGTAVWIIYRVKTAGSDASSAAFTLIVINHCFFIDICNRITAAFLCAAVAATTDFLIDRRFSTCMLLHLSRTASTAHTNVFDSSAESGRFMSFKMTQTDEDICIHDRMSDQCSLTVLSIHNRNFHFICSTQSVTDDNLTSGCSRVESVEICTVQMLQCVLSASRIQSIAVCQKRHSSLFFTQISNNFRIVRAKKSQVPQFSKMHLDCYKFSIHIDIFDTCCDTEFFQLDQLAGSYRTSKVCKINSRFLHSSFTSCISSFS